MASGWLTVLLRLPLFYNPDATGARAVIEVLARALTDRPDAVRVTESQHKHKTLIELFVAPGDLGKVIGRRGARRRLSVPSRRWLGNGRARTSRWKSASHASWTGTEWP